MARLLHNVPLRKLLVLVPLLTAIPATSQTEEYAGAWVLDTGRSDPLRRDGGPLPDVDMTLELRGDDLVVQRLYRIGDRQQQVDFTYVTDGKPHSVPAPMGATREARARWKKDRLNVSYTINRGQFDLDVTETWRLSKSGDEIQITYSTRIGDRNQIRKEIYVRSPGA